MAAQNFFFIDARVENYQAFVAGFQATDSWVLLNAAQDGLDQMVRALNDVTDLASIQIISHGSQGALYLGATVLDSGNLAFYGAQLASIGNALTQSGDILLYGCNVAQGNVGVQFVNALAQATGADVAASDDATGGSLLAGDAVLEQFSGHVETASVSLNGLNGLLAISSLSGLPLGNAPLVGGSLPLGVIGSLPSSVTGSVSNNNDLTAHVIEWTRFLGGRSSADSLTIGADGAIYMAGHAFDQLDGQTNSGKSDAFITRYNPDGTKAWTKLLGGAEHDIASGLTTGADGAIYMAGYTNSNLDGQTNSGSNDAFISRFNADGTKVWTKLLGGSGSDSALSLTTGADGAVYVAGQTSSNLNSQVNSGGSDAFITRYNPNGTLSWTQLLGGSGYDQATSLTTGADGAIYMAGKTSSGAGDSFFIARYKPDGTKVWTQLMGASANDVLFSLTTGADGAIYMAGHTYGNLDAQTNSGESDAFITRYNPDGTKVWTKLSGGGGSDFASSLTAGADGAIYMAGDTSGNLEGQTNGGESNAYIARYNPDGTKAWTKLLNGTGRDYPYSLTTGADGAIYMAGDSGGNAFIVKLADPSTHQVRPVEVYITGTATQGESLTAVFTRPDSDGLAVGPGYASPPSVLNAVAYQWMADGKNITGAIAPSLLLSGAEVGKTITVVAGYMGALGPPESVTAGMTGIVSNINDLPTGTVTISGAATQGQTLSASHTLADIDGLGTVSYQWKADGVNIASATGATLSLAQAQVGKAITVTASYTDPQGTAESKTSLASAAVVNVNDAPTGSVTISGTANQGQTLSASNTLADDDGLGAISYQWLADGANIAGATGSTFVLSQAQWGKAISVVASFTDMGNTSESVTSNITALVADPIAQVNTAPNFAPSQPGMGKAIIPVGTGGDFGRTITLQADGKILVAGFSYNGDNADFSLIRLNVNGSLDTSFDWDGKAIIPVGIGADYGNAITLQADGKILVAGDSSNGISGGFSLIRLNLNGSLDTSFDGDGKAIIPGGSGTAMTLQVDGKILVSGSSWDGSDADFSLIRLNANGSLDTTFDGDGKAIIPVGTAYDQANAIILQADGKILVAGNSSNGTNDDFSLIRLNANGSLDTSFDGDGKVIVPVGTSYDYGNAIMLQADGKILVAGNSYNGGDHDFSLIRLNANGSLDNSFDGDGKAIIPMGASHDNGSAMTLQADGKILMAGYKFSDGHYNFSLIRLNPDGSLDASFDGDGKSIPSVGTGDDYGYAVTLQADGKILVAGASLNGSSSYDFSLIRLNADGSLDSSFGTTPGINSLGGTANYTENAIGIALDSTVVISDPELTALNNGQGNYDGATVNLIRSTGANARDVFGALGNLSFTAGNAVLSGTTIGSFTQSGGSLTVTFNNNATQARVNEALSSLSYANNSDAPPASVQINWTFSDGNTTAQGSGGALAATGSTAVNITAVNDAPTGSVTVSGTPQVGLTLTAANSLADADGMGTVSYQWLADGVSIAGAMGSTFVPNQAQVGKAISVVANYTDMGNTLESVTSNTTSLVFDTIVGVNAAPSFAPPIPGTGKAIISVGQSTRRADQGNAMTLQADGKILVAGTSLGSIDGIDDFSLIRLNANGSRDTSFTGGIIPVGARSDNGNAIALQTDGKILVAGSSVNASYDYDFSLIRLNANGSLDTSFDGDGKAIIPVGASADYGQAITLQADGKILVAGSSSNGSNNDFSLIRLNIDGSLDTSFDGDGKAIIPVGTSSDEARAITLQADGKILVAGSSSGDFSLIRLNIDGSLDTSFDGDGKAIIPVGTSSDEARAITLQADGKILMAGTSSGDFSLIRLNANGSLDTSFDGDGKAIIPVGTSSDQARAITLQADGKILVAGSSYNGSNSDLSLPFDFSLARLKADGSLDPSFSYDGKVIIPVGTSSEDNGRAMTLQADGKILVAGSSLLRGDTAFSLIRLNADGSLDTTLGATPGSNTLGGTVSYTENAPAIALDTKVAISDPELTALRYGQGNYTGASVTLARSTGANAQDVFGASGKLSFTGGNAILSGTTVGSVTQNGGSLTITFNSNATQDRVNEALSSLTYANSSDAPPDSVQINWVFSDGNVGAQGSGGALTGTGSIIVNITAVNDVPTGSVTITGTATQGQTLTAANTLADADGLGTISYQWKADGVNIVGATSSTLFLSQAQEGKAITVTASYTDAQGTAQSKTSLASAVVVNVNDPPTGAVTITGTPTQGQTLTASNSLLDLDGLGAISYQWRAGDMAIAGATTSTLVLNQALVGKAITVVAVYTDGFGQLESVSSSATASVANINDLPTGVVSITGTATQGQILSASNSMADVDGLGTVTYQWQAGGTAIAGATNNTLLLSQAEVGKVITVTASYNDKFGQAESMNSSATASVTNINDLPTGSVTIAGVVTQGQTLTAANTLLDLDGLGAFSYQWKAGGTNIVGATSKTLVLTQSEVAKSITVVASYTDGFGQVESVTSSATTDVANINDVPTGAVTITGTSTQGQTLTASNNLVDLDGIPSSGASAIAYQWKAGGASITGATASTFILTQAEVGKAITVTASYTDQQGAPEFAISTSTLPVANLDDLATASLSVRGNKAVAGSTLVARLNSVVDLDGPITAVSYLWQEDIGASGFPSWVLFKNGSSLLISDDSFVGQKVRVLATTTDMLGGKTEFLGSSITLLSNSPPVGVLTVSGTATQGQVLSAINTLTDADGIPTTGDGAIKYQWKVDGAAINGATASTHTLTQADVGKAIMVTISYTDQQGMDESVTSSATAVVANVNDAPTGGISITGTSTQGQTLTASNTLADADGIPTSGIGAISYQWRAGGTAIAGATGSTLLLTQAEVGKAITVVASYIDGFNQAESVTSGATANVTNIGLPNIGASKLTGHAYDWKTHTLLSDVNVKLTSQIPVKSLEGKSGANGSFGIDSLDAGSYQLDFSKALTTAETGSAINSADALAALKIAVGRNPNADPDGDGPLLAPPVSPYQFIAADANQDGKITSADALAILKMAVKRTDAPAREWLFMNENQDFWNEATSSLPGSLPGSFTTTRSSVLWDKALQVSSPLTTEQNVVAVLKGDVNGSWTPPAGSQDLDITSPSYFTELATKLGTQVNQWAVIG